MLKTTNSATMPIRLFAVRLAKAMTEDIAKILNIQKVWVIIVFQEVPPTEIGILPELSII
jgi:hypothetical protein